jgi:hypothetical protein
MGGGLRAVQVNRGAWFAAMRDERHKCHTVIRRASCRGRCDIWIEEGTDNINFHLDLEFALLRFPLGSYNFDIRIRPQYVSTLTSEDAHLAIHNKQLSQVMYPLNYRFKHQAYYSLIKSICDRLSLHTFWIMTFQPN